MIIQLASTHRGGNAASGAPSSSTLPKTLVVVQRRVACILAASAALSGLPLLLAAKEQQKHDQAAAAGMAGGGSAAPTAAAATTDFSKVTESGMIIIAKVFHLLSVVCCFSPYEIRASLLHLYRAPLYLCSPLNHSFPLLSPPVLSLMPPRLGGGCFIWPIAY